MLGLQTLHGNRVCHALVISLDYATHGLFLACVVVVHTLRMLMEFSLLIILFFLSFYSCSRTGTLRKGGVMIRLMDSMDLAILFFFLQRIVS